MNLGAETDSEDELPPAWEERVTNEGHVYFLNHVTKSTQWTHPRTSKMKKVKGDLPLGWQKSVGEDGKILYTHSEKNLSSFTDPRLAFAVEETNNSQSTIRQRFDASSTANAVLHGKDLCGKVALITGANSGIGLETAKTLALHGCEIIFACRSESSALEAIEAINLERKGSKLTFMKLDLSSLKSVQSFCTEVKKNYQLINYLILNAGVFALPHTLTEDGFETIFQVSHLSHHFMTLELSPLLTHESRVVVLSSESHRFANLPSNGLTREILNPSQSKFWSMMAYNNAKLCNVLFARELAKKWLHRGVCVFAVHPGNMISTNITKNWWFYRFLFAIVRPFTKSMQQGCATTVFTATAEELTGLTGIYLNNCYICEPSKLAQNDAMSEDLWNISQKMIADCLETYKN
ncbi:unnamed protein product [Diamesa hyperborea]